jgi:arginyl-tRNA synthetase
MASSRPSIYVNKIREVVTVKLFREELVRLLAEVVPLEPEEIGADLESPPSPELGDYAFPCFKLAKLRKTAPGKIAADLAGRISPAPLFAKVEAAGPYLNFYCDKEKLTELTLGMIAKEKDQFGHQDQGRGKTVVLDFSAPNIAKPFGIGHLRSTVIGNSLYRIHAALGYNCVGINHIGDWGTQFGKLIAAYLRWGNPERLAQEPIEYLYELYVQFHQEAETDQTLDDEGRSWFKKLEDGDPQAVELWQRFRDLSLAEFQRVYSILDVDFDSWQGESFYNDMLDKTVAEVSALGLLQQSQGAWIVDLEEEGMPPCLLRKQDGATLYATRDLSAAIYRYNTWKFAKMLYVVGVDQTLHFRQLFAVLKKMGYQWADACEHIPFGLFRFKEGKMSTRQGNLILLDDVLTKAIELAGEIIAEKNPELENREEVARQVGIGAVIFGDLYNDRIKDIEFDWEQILDFSGETAPYVQYAHARICSILRKAGRPAGTFAAALLDSEYERALVSVLSKFPGVIERAAETCKPSLVARHLVDVAKEFNRFYHQCPVLNAEADVRDSRLALVDGVRQVLANGLYLLGIAAPEEM